MAASARVKTKPRKEKRENETERKQHNNFKILWLRFFTLHQTEGVEPNEK
jgi:hypothetical protein